MELQEAIERVRRMTDDRVSRMKKAGTRVIHFGRDSIRDVVAGRGDLVERQAGSVATDPSHGQNQIGGSSPSHVPSPECRCKLGWIKVKAPMVGKEATCFDLCPHCRQYELHDDWSYWRVIYER